MGSQEEEAGFRGLMRNPILCTFCPSCHHVINLETSSDKPGISKWTTAENFKAKVEIWVSHCHHCGSSEKMTSEFSERHKEGKRTPLDMLEEIPEGDRKQANREMDKDRLCRKTH